MIIGFIGLGNVGSKLSGSLLRNGFDVFVYDVNSQLTAEFAKKGAKIGENPAHLMSVCDFVITVLPSPAASYRLMQKMIPCVKESKSSLAMSLTNYA